MTDTSAAIVSVGEGSNRPFQPLILMILWMLSIGFWRFPTQGQETNRTLPIDLPTALHLANAQNLDIQMARARLAEARANHDSAIEKFFPWLSPGIGYRRHDGRIQDVAGTIFEAEKQSYTVGGTFAAQVEVGDAVYQTLVAKQQVCAADYALASQRQDATLAAAWGYFDLANAQSLAAVVREALGISAEYQKQLHDAVAAGLAFKGDELRVTVQTERYRMSLSQALEKQRNAAARLAETLHLDSKTELVPEVGELIPLKLFDTNAPLDSLVQQALRSRPEIKESRSLVSAARDSKKGALYGPLIPSVGAQAFLGGLGGGKDERTGNFGPSEDYSVNLGWRIGPGGLFDTARSRAANARLESVRLAGAKLEDAIVRQVVESHTRFHSLLNQLDAARQTLHTAAETLRLTRDRKEFGVGAVLEDIQAQQDLTRARSDYLDVVAEFNKAQYSLARASGAMPNPDQR